MLNPDFLSSNSHILNSIEIVHETGGAVSLIQKQVEMLRQNYESTSSNLLQLLDIAKNNEGIFEKTKKLILELIVCRNLTDVVSMTEDTFKREFKADACKVLFFKENNQKNSRNHLFLKGANVRKTSTLCVPASSKGFDT